MVTAEEFVHTVMTLRDIKKIAEHLDISEPVVKQRIIRYRKQGVKLPALHKRNGRKINVSHLNNIVGSYK